MTLSISPKYSTAAVAAVASLVIAGCSSDEADNAQETSTVTSTSETSSAESSTTKADKEKADKEKAKADKDKDKKKSAEDSDNEDTNAAASANSGNSPQPEEQPEARSADPVNPFENAPTQPSVDIAPIEGGQPADEATAQEIRDLLNNAYEVTTVKQLISYVPDNTCRSLIEEQGGAQAFDTTGIPDIPLDQVPSFNSDQSYVESVEDIRVNGNRASAVVTTHTANGSDTAVNRFLREDNRWKFCN